MEETKIVDLNERNLTELAQVCVPSDRKDEINFIKGIGLKREYLEHYFEKFGSIAKLAYQRNELLGFIQYLPKQEERTIEIQCIFVTHRDQQGKGIGKKLLQALIEEMVQPKEYFNGQKARALVTFAFDAQSGFPQNKFYLKNGFKKIHEDDEFYLYYPIEKDYKYEPTIKESDIKKLPEDKGKALLFINPFCSFCYFFAKKTEELIRTVKEDIEVEYYNILTQKEEVKKRGGIVPDCIVNQNPIEVFFMESEEFLEEVKKNL